jgi:predicted nucleic acid-binding protein
MAESCILDTDVVSFIVRYDTRADLYHDYLADKQLAISFMPLAELRRWALAHQWGESRRARLVGFLHRFDVHYANDALCSAWATIVAMREQQGRPIATSDAWVAAPAWLAGIPLVTHNRRHFANIAGLDVVSFAPGSPDSA